MTKERGYKEKNIGRNDGKMGGNREMAGGAGGAGAVLLPSVRAWTDPKSHAMRIVSTASCPVSRGNSSTTVGYVYKRRLTPDFTSIRVFLAEA